MAETRIWSCDRCGREWNSNEHSNPLETIAIMTPATPARYRTSAPLKKHWEAEWCTECRLETGVTKPDAEGDKPPGEIEPLSLEDMVREIVREEIGAA